jgi:hypothetical protein
LLLARVVVLLLTATLLSSCAQKSIAKAGLDGACNKQQQSAAKAQISSQIDAIADQNWPTAYSYAAKSFKDSIDLPSFTQIIKRQYQMLINNQRYSFGSCQISDGQVVQQVKVSDVKGEYLLDYKLSIEQAKLGVSSVFITFLSAVAST